MHRCATPEDVSKFERAGSNGLLVLGGPDFMKNPPRNFRGQRSKGTLDQIINSVTCRMDVDRDLVLSKSQQQECTLVRALIAWYATERRVATLAAVARRFRRNPSTLSSAVRRYRAIARRPELFKITAMPDISSLVAIGSSPPG